MVGDTIEDLQNRVSEVENIATDYCVSRATALSLTSCDPSSFTTLLTSLGIA